MTNKQFRLNQKINKDRLDKLYERSLTASVTLLIINAVYALLLTSQFSWRTLLVWYLVLFFVLVARWLLNRFYVAAKSRQISIPLWLTLFRFSILAVGLTVGSLNILFFPEGSLTFVLMAIILPYGIAMGAVTILVDFLSFVIYAITLMLPILYQTIQNNDIGTAILTTILTIFLLRFSKEYNNNFIRNMRLRHKNKDLVDELRREKNTLDNRLARILNDSSNEIFIVDGDSYNCLQVNKGAIENLGYAEEEFAELNLFDIFTELDRESLGKLLVHLYDGSRDTVIYTGNNRRKDGSIYPVEARLQIATEDAPPIIVITAQDITERREWEKKLIYQANFDQLTGLYNRHYMQSYMLSIFARAKRQNQKVALIFMDLDNFKNINDTLGHDVGDEVLKQTAGRILSILRESDTPARMGGDEFTVLLEGLKENSHADLVARKLVDIFKKPFIVKGREVYTSASIGISVYPEDSTSLDQLMQYADIAMYQAKDDGRNNHRFFSRKMRRSSERQMEIANHLRYALAKDELSLCFQPKININQGRIIGAEALLRWHNKRLGDVSPNVFIPLAENLGIIREVGAWVLEQACREAKHWQKLTPEKVQVSVNVSPQQFRTGRLLADVNRALTLCGLHQDRLELEITESLLLHDSDKHLTILKTLHEYGVSLALDDFGTGYSSLSYLRLFPLQVLKVDRSFISDIEENQNSQALVAAIIAMAKSLKLEVVAEGVENEKQLAFLQKHGVLLAQGYFFSPPVSAEKFRSLLLDNQLTEMTL